MTMPARSSLFASVARKPFPRRLFPELEFVDDTVEVTTLPSKG